MYSYETLEFSSIPRIENNGFWFEKLYLHIYSHCICYPWHIQPLILPATLKCFKMQMNMAFGLNKNITDNLKFEVQKFALYLSNDPSVSQPKPVLSITKYDLGLQGT